MYIIYTFLGNMFLSVVLVLIVVTVSLWSYWLKIVRSGSGPMVKGSLPIIGYTHKIIGDTENLYDSIKDMSYDSLANGGVSRIILMFKTYYVVTDPEDLTTVGNNALKKHFSFDFAKPWLGDGLVTAPTPVWKQHRKLLSPAFSLNLLHGFVQVFNEQAREMVDRLAGEVDKGPVEISHYLKDNAMSTLSRTSLGLSEQGKSDLLTNYLRAADEILEMIVTRFQNAWLHSDLVYKLTGLKKKETELIEELNKFSDVVIKAKKSRVEEISNVTKMTSTEQGNNAFFDRLLKFSLNGTLTEEDIRAEIQTILVAGIDTSSWVVTYICVALGSYPEVQQKVFEELTEIFEDSDRDVTKEDLQKLVYMEAVIKETLRLYPIGPVSVRTVESGFNLKNHYLRPGDHVIMSFYGVNRHPVWGPDVDQFRPERWLEENTLPNAFAGFGVGKRNCIGKTYAIISAKVLLSHLLRHYHFAGDVSKLKFKMDYVAKPVSGHLVTISNRNQRSDLIRKNA